MDYKKNDDVPVSSAHLFEDDNGECVYDDDFQGGDTVKCTKVKDVGDAGVEAAGAGADETDTPMSTTSSISTAASPTGSDAGPLPTLRMRKYGQGAPTATPEEIADNIASSNAELTQADEWAKLPPGELKEFLWTTSPHPHAVRRRAILKAHPEIEQLYGSDPSQAVLLFGTIFVQFFMAYLVYAKSLSWGVTLLLSFFVSGTLNHSLFTALHEASHRTIFEGKFISEFVSVLTTLPSGFPSAIPFKRYHLDHHIYQGVDVLDPDLPTPIEAELFRGTFRKIIWMLLLPFTYSLRPVILRPKAPVLMDAVNWVLNLAVNYSVAKFWGGKALLYLLLGTFWSMSVHPFAGHFLSEHYVIPTGRPDFDVFQETNSVYTFWNYITYNIGYHNEHHDFPRVPGSKLPLVKRIAPEFYSMPTHTSWLQVILQFVFNKNVAPYNRIKRLHVRGMKHLPKRLQAAKIHDGHIPKGGEGHYWPLISKHFWE